MKIDDVLFRIRELRNKIHGGDESFDSERLAALNFAENAIVSAPITCENIYFDEYGFAHDRKVEKPQTNADRIRQMSDDEMADLCEEGCPPIKECPDYQDFKDDSYHNYCKRCWLDWLRGEATDG